MRDSEKAEKLLDIISDEILPLTESETDKGNKIFGAAIVRKDTLTSVMVGTDDSAADPLSHGAIDTLERFYKLPVRPEIDDLIFLTPFELCPMCAAAVAITGINEVWVLYDQKDMKEMLPEDALTHEYRDLFGIKNVKADNPYYEIHYLKQELDDSAVKHIDEITKRYIDICGPKGEGPIDG